MMASRFFGRTLMFCALALITMGLYGTNQRAVTIGDTLPVGGGLKRDLNRPISAGISTDDRWLALLRRS